MNCLYPKNIRQQKFDLFSEKYIKNEVRPKFSNCSLKENSYLNCPKTKYLNYLEDEDKIKVSRKNSSISTEDEENFIIQVPVEENFRDINSDFYTNYNVDVYIPNKILRIPQISYKSNLKQRFVFLLVFMEKAHMVIPVHMLMEIMN